MRISNHIPLLVITVWIGTLSGLNAAPASTPATGSASPVIATIGNESITLKELEDRLKSFPESYQPALEKRENKVKVLNQMIDELLLSQKAAETNLTNTPEFQKKLAAYKRQLLADLFVETKIEQQVTVNTKEIAQYYKAHPEMFGKTEERHVWHILVTTPEEAEIVMDKIKKGDSFERLAEQHSIHPSGKEGGEIGWLHRGQVDSTNFETQAFTLKKGAFGKVQSSFGYHVIWIKGIRTRPAIPLETAQDQIRQRLLSEKKETALKDLLESLRSNARIERNISQIP